MMSQMNAVTRLTKFLQTSKKNLGWTYKVIVPKLENQPESLLNEATSSTSMDDNFVQLTRIGFPLSQEVGIDNEIG